MLIAGFALIPGVVSAQTYGRVITFGDSLSDNGNLFTVAGTPPAPYYQGRFSNGLVWAEYLNGPMLKAGTSILGIPPTPGTLPGTANLNFAFGGARTDANVAVPPGTVTQITNYIALGGRFQASDLVTLWAGANDIFQSAPSQAAVTVAATNAAVNVGNQIRTLAGAGAPTILVMNLPDLGAAPNYLAQGPLGVQLGSYATATFNSTWSASVSAAAAANPQANVIQVPIDQLLNAAVANPGRFGLANVTSQCIQTVSCVTGNAATQATFLFWDGVHPTTAGHALISNFMQEYLYAPSRAASAAGLGDVGFWSRRQAMSDMMDRVQTANPADGKSSWFVSVVGEQGQRDTTAIQAGFAGNMMIASAGGARYSAGGLRLGVFHRYSPAWTVGLALSATAGDAKSGHVSFTPVGFAADLVARWSQGPTFVNLGVGAQVNLYRDIERKTLLADLTNTGSTTGHAYSAVAEAGYRWDMGSYALTPKARLAWVSAGVNRFSETGVVAPVSYFDRTVQGLAAGAELRAEANLGTGTLAHAVIGYEEFLYKSAGTLGGQLINNTAKPFAVRISDPVGAGLLLGVGLDTTIGGWKASANYRATVGQKNQITHRGQITVGASF
jgi:outer membrane lipase/esterase